MRSQLCIFLDLKKAFDTIDHSLLLEKLYCLGICGPACELLKSYLTNTLQCVCIKGLSTQMEQINCGVPLGSVLGALLFIIFIDYLPSVIENLTLFADDIDIFERVPKNDYNGVLKSLDTIDKWMKFNQVKCKVDKSEAVMFGKNKSSNFTFGDLEFNVKSSLNTWA